MNWWTVGAFWVGALAATIVFWKRIRLGQFEIERQRMDYLELPENVAPEKSGFKAGFVCFCIVVSLMAFFGFLGTAAKAPLVEQMAYKQAMRSCDSTIAARDSAIDLISARHIEELKAMQGTIGMYQTEIRVALNQRMLDAARIEELKAELERVKPKMNYSLGRGK
jgi:hypothetical protein